MLGPSIIGGGVGRDGQPGDAGATPVLQAGNASALAYGSAPQVALRETAPHTYAVDISWPVAKDGAAGGKGDTGATPTLQVGNVTALAAGAVATAAVRALGGAAYAIDLGIPVGTPGGKGDAGTTPTLQLGSVTTLASGASATAAVRSLGGAAYAIDLGIPQGASGAAAPGGGVTRRMLVGSQRISAGGTWTVADADIAFPNWDEIDVRCISGGSSGWTQQTPYGSSGSYGGFGGAVAQRSGIRRSDLVSAGGSVATTVGVGGAAPANNSNSNMNGGTGSSFGTYVRSAAGLSFASPTPSSTFFAYLWAFAPVTQFEIGAPGGNERLRGQTGANTYGGYSASASLGPGSGGGGGWSSGNIPAPGGSGGNGDVAQGNVAGGAGSNGSTQVHGLNGSDGAIGSFGGGGGGGGAQTPAPYGTNAGKGGFPGGGGGGAGAATANSSGYLGVAGAGGNGCIDIFYYRRVAE